MIKTYVYTKPMNNISHILTGNGGNTARFNFTNGNIITKKLPELTLRGEYYQKLLEDSELFKKGFVRLVNSVPEESDITDTTKASSSDSREIKEEVLSVHNTSELIAYVNERFDKDTRTLATAMKIAAKAGLIFPNFEP